jgi:UDP-N-acetylglucosamine/UDP-N-acetylgalactosamine diphosphorylase
MNQSQLEQIGQAHLLQFWDQLPPESQQQLESQIAGVDFEQLKRLIDAAEDAVDWSALAAQAEPPPAARLNDPRPLIDAQDAIRVGEEALRGGKVGMILVAGGQGTRLGFQPPKGMFPIGPVSARTLFQMHCDRLLAMMKRYRASMPMYVMTSPATDAETREYFAQTDRCGLAKDQLIIFCQGTMPAVDAETGRVLLATKGSLALSPDGHGGLVDALARNGCLADARRRGIEYLYYAQVDNPLAQLCDPELIGYHILSRSQLTTQVVKKRFATERVGNVVAIEGRVQIIEYSDLPESAAQQTNADGSLKLWAGNIAVHVFDLQFLQSVVDSVAGLPFHRAHKKVPYVDSTGQLVEPEQPNAIKFERFVFDLLPMAERAFVVEGDPAQIFAPVKNANGAEFDTPEHAQQAISHLHRRWLETAGARVADGVRIEIHPAWALDAAEAKEQLQQIPKRGDQSDGGQVEFVSDTFLR